MSARALHLVSRPGGMPADSDFELREVALRAPSEGEIDVEIMHISIDPAMRVWMSEQRSYWPPVPLNDVMRAFAVGRVLASNTPNIKVGEIATGMFGVCERYIGSSKGVRSFAPAQLPDPTLTLSALGATGLTAYFGLLDIGRPQAGESLVVSAAAGAVGSMVVQIAKQKGLRVVALAGGAEKCAYVQSLGADGVIDYKNEDVGARLKALLPDGVDIYFDNVGGPILDECLKRLRMRGRVVLCGGISQYNNKGAMQGPSQYLSLISMRGRMEGFVVIDYLHRADEAYAELVPWLHGGKLRDKVDRVDGLENFVSALNRLYLGQNFGKQILSVGS
jgi:hypothetical protein